jgi:ABC-2 type transport system permease protein
MSVFKATFAIFKKNSATLILSLAISVFISFTYSVSYGKPAEQLTKPTIAVFNRDHGALAQHLETYLAKSLTVVSIKDTQESVDDALFFKKVDSVVTIPASFSEKIEQRKRANLPVRVSPDSFSQVYIDSLLNNFLSTYQFYQSAFPAKTGTELMALTQKNLQTKGTVHFDSSYLQLKRQESAGRVFGVLSYTLFMTIFGTITLASLAFNRKEIKTRNSCSPISKRMFAIQHLGIQLILCLAIWGIFVSVVLLTSKSAFGKTTLYFILNTVLLFLISVSFSIFIGRIVSNSNMITGINNVFILGSAFISGVFVQADILPEMVTKAASFTPTYWYMKNCTLIGKTLQFNQAFLNEFLFNSFILLLFTGIFLLLTLLTNKERAAFHFSLKKSSI